MAAVATGAARACRAVVMTTTARRLDAPKPFFSDLPRRSRRRPFYVETAAAVCTHVRFFVETFKGSVRQYPRVTEFQSFVADIFAFLLVNFGETISQQEISPL